MAIEFKLTVQKNGNRVKPLIVKGKDGLATQDIMRIARAEAWKIGMGHVEVLDVLWSENAGGWCVVVQSV